MSEIKALTDKVRDPFIPSGNDPRLPMWELWETGAYGELTNLLEVSPSPPAREKPTDVLIRRWWLPASNVMEVRRG